MRGLPGFVAFGLVLTGLTVRAAFPAGVVDGLGQIDLVDPATNADMPFGNPPFSTDSLAVDPAGNFYSADAFGVLFQITGTGLIPVGPTIRTQIADLDYAPGGLWGYSNASQELFFFDLGTLTVSYSATLATLASYTITGVAHQASTGDVFLSGNLGLNTDELFQVDLLPVPSVSLIGSLLHADASSYVSDIDFDGAGMLLAMTWFHRHFYAVNPATAATAPLSVGPHRDATALAINEVPEPAALVPAAVALSAGMWLARWRRSRNSTARSA